MPVRGIIITHALLAEAFIATVEQIAGKQEYLQALSNLGLSNDELARRMREFLADGEPTIIFTDFNAGSTYAVARQVVDSCRPKENAACAALTGVNLPMLISFVTKRDQLPFADLVEILRQDGHRGIQ